MPRRIRYQVAASLDGYIAGPNGEFDWIVADPDIDFGELFNQFDTFLIGRGTFESMVRQQGSGAIPEGDRLLADAKPEGLPRRDDRCGGVGNALTALRNETGKDIWVFGAT